MCRKKPAYLSYYRISIGRIIQICDIHHFFIKINQDEKFQSFLKKKSVFHDSGSRQIKALRVVWTPLLKTKFFSAYSRGDTLGPPWGSQGGWSDEHPF